MKQNRWFFSAANTWIASFILQSSVHSLPVTDGLVVRMDGSQLETEEEPVYSPVELWPDLSGHGNHAGQSEIRPHAHPKLVPGATPTGGAAVRFTKAMEEYLEIPGSEDFSGSTFTWYIVARPNSQLTMDRHGRVLSAVYGNVGGGAWGEFETLASLMSNGNRFRSRGRSTTGASLFTDVSAPLVTPDNFIIGGSRWNAATGLEAFVVDKDGSRHIAENPAVNGNLSDNRFLRIGGTERFFDGDIAEILFYNRVLTAQEQEVLEAYLYTRHFIGGTSGELPVPAGLVLWLDAAEVLLDIEAPEPVIRVTEWTDQSGRGNHAGAAQVGASYPRLAQAVTATGKHAVRFDGAREILEIPGNPEDFDGPELTWFIAFRAEEFREDTLNHARLLSSAYQALGAGSSGEPDYAAWSTMVSVGGRFRAQGRDVAGDFISADVVDALTTETFAVGSGIWNSSAGQLIAVVVDAEGTRSVNMVTGASGNPTQHLFTRIGAGSAQTNPVPSRYFLGDIAEILIYNRLLTEEEHREVVFFLAEKYDLTPLRESPISLYWRWIADYGIQDDLQAPESDASGDGVPNLLKYAFGLNPADASREGMPEIEIKAEGSERHLTLTVTRDPEAEGIEWMVESSSDMIEWQPADLEILEDSPSLLRVRILHPMD